MYGANQVLKHKETGELAQIVPNEGSAWAWNIGKETPFVDKDGNNFTDNIKDYGPIRDEFDRPVSGNFEKCDKYSLTQKEMRQLQKKSLLAWEARVLKSMDNSLQVSNVFADGSRCDIFCKWFLKRRDAKPLFKQYHWYKKRFTNSGMQIFTYKGRMWLYNHLRGDLTVIKM
jgi:hypothetical protein